MDLLFDALVCSLDLEACDLSYVDPVGGGATKGSEVLVRTVLPGHGDGCRS